MSTPEHFGGTGSQPPVLAATVVCLRDGSDGPEVLMLRRRSKGAFGGLWVFPGGRVDSDDWRPGDDEIAAGRRAAAREAREEAGLALDPESLVVHSFWLPPDEAARRFATWFYLGRPSPAGPIVLSEDEVGAHRWARPEAILDEHGAGLVPLAPPTWVTLHGLRGASSVAALVTSAGERPPAMFRTHAVLDAAGGLSCTLWEGDVAYEDLDLDPARPGPRRRLLVGAGPWRLVVDPVGDH